MQELENRVLPVLGQVARVGAVQRVPAHGQRVGARAEPEVEDLEALELDPAGGAHAVVAQCHPEAGDHADLDRKRLADAALAECRDRAGAARRVAAVVDNDHVGAGAADDDELTEPERRVQAGPRDPGDVVERRVADDHLVVAVAGTAENSRPTLSPSQEAFGR